MLVHKNLKLNLLIFQQWATFGRVWHVYDCTYQNPFDSAKVIVKYLKGMQKPIYHPMSKLIINPVDHDNNQNVYYDLFFR